MLSLAENGHIDPDRWEMAPGIYTVHRFWEGEGDVVGEMDIGRQ